MSKKARLFLVGYLVSFFLFAFTLLFFAKFPKDYKDLQTFVQLSGMSDTAFYSDMRAVRFYSLSKAEDLWNDPFLPPRSGTDFVYRMQK